jgi:pimeloyl-ACP methyl ester carboxylesterase
MPILTVNTRQCSYISEGDGFPLLLTSGPLEPRAVWEPLMPLLGELCHTTAYAYCHPVSAPAALLTDDFVALLDLLGYERAYLATAHSALALHVALHAPERLEGLVLVGTAEAEGRANGDRGHGHTLPLPMLHVVGEHAVSSGGHTDRIGSHLPHSRQIIVPDAGEAPHHEQPRRTGHAIMRFLTQCERQRTLVRGASFLL